MIELPDDAGTLTKQSGMCRTTTSATARRLRHECPATECGSLFSSLVHLDQHLRKAHPCEKLVKCEACGQVFGSHHGKAKHFRKLHQEKIHPCAECSKKFSDKYELFRHVHKVHSKWEYLCPYCHKVYKSESNRRRHMDDRHQDRCTGHATILTSVKRDDRPVPQKPAPEKITRRKGIWKKPSTVHTQRKEVSSDTGLEVSSSGQNAEEHSRRLVRVSNLENSTPPHQTCKREDFVQNLVECCVEIKREEAAEYTSEIDFPADGNGSDEQFVVPPLESSRWERERSVGADENQPETQCTVDSIAHHESSADGVFHDDSTPGPCILTSDKCSDCALSEKPALVKKGRRKRRRKKPLTVRTKRKKVTADPVPEVSSNRQTVEEHSRTFVRVSNLEKSTPSHQTCEREDLTRVQNLVECCVEIKREDAAEYTPEIDSPANGSVGFPPPDSSTWDMERSVEGDENQSDTQRSLVSNADPESGEDLPSTSETQVSVSFLKEVMSLTTLLCNPAIEAARNQHPSILTTLQTFFSLIIEKRVSPNFLPFLRFQEAVNSRNVSTADPKVTPALPQKDCHGG